MAVLCALCNAHNTVFGSKRSAICVQADGQSVKSCVDYLTKTISPGSLSIATARIAPKICRG